MQRTHKLTTLTAILILPMLAIFGCGESESDPTQSAQEHGNDQTGLSDELFLSEPPEDVQPIAALKQSANEGDEVTVRVVVGGRVNPIVDGRASTMVVDATQPNMCLSDDDHCHTPWDYCCEPPEELNQNMAAVQVVDEEGRIVAADLSRHFQPLSTLVVSGTVGPRPDPQVLSIHADGIYVEPQND